MNRAGLILLTLLFLGLGIVALPIHGEVRWRKTWSGSLGVCWRVTGLGIPLNQGRMRRQILMTDWPQGWRQRWRIIRWLLRFGRVHHWQVSADIGFRDPALTGQWLGVISALPPVIGRCIHLTFTRTGWQLRGKLQGSIALGWLLALGLKLGWARLHACLRLIFRLIRTWQRDGTGVP